jgi:hypothetical protein
MAYTLYLTQDDEGKSYTVTRCHDSLEPDLKNKQLLYSTPSFSIRDDCEHVNYIVKYFTNRNKENPFITFAKRIFQKR